MAAPRSPVRLRRPEPWTRGRILVTDRHRYPEPLPEYLSRVVASMGVGAVWLREKDLNPTRLRELGAAVLNSISVPLLVSGPEWLAKDIGAKAAHLPFIPSSGRGGLSVADGLVRGTSVHSVAEAEAAAAGDLDYIVFGPVLDTVKGDAAIPGSGFAKLRAVCERAGDLPVVAIGGLGFEHEHEVFAAGARAWAGIRCFLEGPSE